MGQCHHIWIQIQQEPLHLPWPEGKGSETVGWMASGWQIHWIPGLLSIKMGRQHICLHDRLTDQTTTCPNKRRKRRIRTWAEHGRLQGRPPLIGTILVVIRFLSFILIVIKNCYGARNNVWKFQVSTLKIVPVVRMHLKFFRHLHNDDSELS